MDGFGIVYLIENAQEFWSELEDIVKIPADASLSLLDATLKRSLTFCASYHELYLQSPLQLEHACDLILDSELFAFHSERMCEILTDETAGNTDPHAQFMLYSVLLYHGRRSPSFLRSHKRWQPLIPLLMDHVLVDMDPDVEDTFSGLTHTSGPSTGGKGSAIHIEARLRSLSVRLLYEVCRSSKLSIGDLKVFSDHFLDKLFDLVEQTRSMHDETFNYSVIKLIIAINEQFMVAELTTKPQNQVTSATHSENRVLHVLIRRHGTSQTFGENLIFMLNRARRTPEDLVMQLLVLKVLYILFNTKGLSEYFYTNDLCVLVDVFLREIVDLDEDSESLRHTYLRVLHPLLTKTQLRSLPYKRSQIVRALESLIANQEIREVSSTTTRLVERCLNGEWCVQHRSSGAGGRVSAEFGMQRSSSPSSDRVAAQSLTPKLSIPSAPTNDPSLLRRRSLKGSRSAENLRSLATANPKPASRALDALHKPTNDSSLNVANASPPIVAATHSHRTSSETLADKRSADRRAHPPAPREVIIPPVRHNSLSDQIMSPVGPHSVPRSPPSPLVPASTRTSDSRAPPSPVGAPSVSRSPPSPLVPASARKSEARAPPSPVGAPSVSRSPPSPLVPASVRTSETRVPPPPNPASSTVSGTKKVQRRSPPPPPKRRKPPAVPIRVVGKSNGGADIAAIASSTSPHH